MLPNNNFSVIPWYESLVQQNAEKWWIAGKVYPLFVQGAYLVPFQIILPHDADRSAINASFTLYRADGTYVGAANITPTLYSFASLGYDVYVWNASSPIRSSLPVGRYYLKMNDETVIRYSEIFTVLGNTEPYLRINWYDAEDLVMDAGRIVYQNSFANILYLKADLAKPQYLFSEEGEERDGYFYPVKQISEKRYQFKFWASEYLLDVMRFIRLSDYVTVHYRGQTYPVDSFLLTPEWEDAGDVASVTVEFDTATAVKKLGVGYVRSLRGDFNDDYNDDYSNQRGIEPEEENEDENR